MIDFATAAMVPALKHLWMVCFGDDDRYTELIFHGLIRPENVLAYTDPDYGLMAMLCIEPFAIVSPAGEAAAVYIYGVATAPEHQGKGLSTALMEEAHIQLQRQGIAVSCLVPASESLFGFYGKRGYETAFQVKKATISQGDIPLAAQPCRLTPAKFGNLSALRNRFYSGRELFVRWGREYLAYIGDECAALDGEVLAIECGGEEGFAVCYRGKNSVLVKELAVDEALLDDILAAIHRRYDVQSYTVYFPPDTNTACPNKVLPFAMVKWYDREKQAQLAVNGAKAPYIAHVLD